jgi:hypothetical protein
MINGGTEENSENSKFLFYHSFLDLLLVHPASYPVGTWVFPWR